ncbi:19794_t:CDS:10 [Funneliformis geosporum]|nr:19794_t:CDS:10 [Funneliformis geosporum]
MLSYSEKDISIEATDLSRWRLKIDHGRQTWHYLEIEEAKNWPQSIIEKYWLGISFESKKFDKPKTALESARKGFEFFKLLQTEDGHWAGEYGGPMFLLPGLIISMYITHITIPDSWRIEIIRYLFNKANPVDGGWGIHVEGHSTVFGTALNYVVLRILGIEADHPYMVKARATLHKLGSAIAIPSWGKFWLSCLNAYNWEGMNPVPPELWLLPYAIPVHPGRFWVHTRAVYLPMGYMYGRRLSIDVNPFIESLRQELYDQPYDTIDWARARNNVSEADLYLPQTKALKFLNLGMTVYEKLPNFFGLRQISLDECYKLMQYEDKNTDYLDIAPVNKVMHILCTYYEEGPNSEAFKLAKERLIDYMWMSSEGMMMNGTNGSQLWDTALAAQAIIDAGLGNNVENHDSMLKALEFLDDAQIKRNPTDMEYCYRHPSKGAWGFSTRDQGYTVADCTAEGLKAVLYLQNKLNFKPTLVSKERLCQAVDILLTMQNDDGGFASYEKIRGSEFLEWINPSEVFGKIMIEYSYPECTTAVLTGLSLFKKYYPDYRVDEIEKVCQKAAKFVHTSQKEDGSWYGSWAICFTYASMFALESLAYLGETYENSESVRKGCEFLISKQNDDGGWGESYKSCETGVYSGLDQSQVVNTAYALLGLMSAKYPDEKVLRRGIELIMSRQLSTGEWKQEAIEGVFNKNVAISYPNYKFVFTIWALGKYAKIHNNPTIQF